MMFARRLMRGSPWTAVRLRRADVGGMGARGVVFSMPDGLVSKQGWAIVVHRYAAVCFHGERAPHVRRPGSPSVASRIRVPGRAPRSVLPRHGQPHAGGQQLGSVRMYGRGQRTEPRALAVGGPTGRGCSGLAHTGCFAWRPGRGADGRDRLASPRGRAGPGGGDGSLHTRHVSRLARPGHLHRCVPFAGASVDGVRTVLDGVGGRRAVPTARASRLVLPLLSFSVTACPAGTSSSSIGSPTALTCTGAYANGELGRGGRGSATH